MHKFFNDNKLFCFLCNKIFNDNSKYKHFQTKLHKYFENLSNNIISIDNYNANNNDRKKKFSFVKITIIPLI